MDDARRAVCYALRNPPAGEKATPSKDIRRMVRMVNGQRPGINAIQKAASTYTDERGARGRPAGTTGTTKEEHKQSLDTIHKMRPPGHSVDSRVVHTASPKKLKKDIGRRTVIKRLAEQGFTPQRKLDKDEPGVKQNAKRAYARKRKDKNF